MWKIVRIKHHIYVYRICNGSPALIHCASSAYLNPHYIHSWQVVASEIVPIQPNRAHGFNPTPSFRHGNISCGNRRKCNAYLF